MDELWTFEQPAVPGWYCLNLGDVVTEANFEVVQVQAPINKKHWKDPGNLFFVDKAGETIQVAAVNPSWKWLRLDPSKLNQVGNAE